MKCGQEARGPAWRRLALVVALAGLLAGVSACQRPPVEAPAAPPPVGGAPPAPAAPGARAPTPTSPGVVGDLAFGGRGAAAAPLARQAAPGSSFSFLVYGDTRSNPRVHRRVIALMASMAGISFACHTGDLVERSSSAEEWATFLSVTEPLRSRMPFYPAVGNHDLPRRYALAAFRRINGPPRDLAPDAMYYGIECGLVRIAVLDSESLVKGDEAQLRWLEGFLRETRTPYRVVMLHRPLWSPGPNGSCVPIRNRLLPLLHSAQVNLVLAGHDHMYYRTVRDGLTEVMTGGGAAPLYGVTNSSVIQPGDVVGFRYHVCRVDVTPDALDIRAIGLGGERIDSVRVRPVPGSGG